MKDKLAYLVEHRLKNNNRRDGFDPCTRSFTIYFLKVGEQKIMADLVEKINTFAKELSFELATRPALLSEEEREALTKLELRMGTIGKIVSGEDAYDLLIKEIFN